MTYVPYSFPLTGGLDRSTIPCKSNPASFYNMFNFRQSSTYRGKAETTPKFTLLSTVAQGTYYNGATSVTGPSSSPVVWYGDTTGANISGSLTMTGYCVFDTQAGTTQYKTIVQTTAPLTDGLTKGCLLTVENSTTMSITLGNLYEVVIDGATTFKWRVNGGAYTTLVAINLATGNFIDGGAIRLYWLTDTGFTVNDTWVWTRQDTSCSSTNTADMLASIPPVAITPNGFYYRDTVGRIMIIQRPTTGNPVVRSVGYRPVYGTTIWTYQGHLFIFGTNATGTASVGSYILNSDLNNYDSFTATDVNEADVFASDFVADGPINFMRVLSGFVVQNRLFVNTTCGIYYTDYSGLPTPFAFKLLFPMRMLCTEGNYSVSTDKGVFLYRDDRLFYFNGVQMSSLFDLSTVGLTSPSYVSYNPFDDEVIFHFRTSGMILVYQTAYQTFYTRSVDFDSTGFTTLTISPANVMYTGSASRKVFFEDVQESNTPVSDYAHGASVAVPKLTTQLIGDNVSKVKESAPVFIAGDVSTTGGAAYSIAGFIKVLSAWYVSSSGLIAGSPTTDASSYWTNASTDGKISTPRTSYRYLAFELTVTGTNGSKPPAYFTLQALETQVYSTPTVLR